MKPAALLVLVLLSGCTADEARPTNGAPGTAELAPASAAAPVHGTATPAGSPAPARAVASPAAAPAVTVSTSAVAGVRIGTAAAEAERRLRAALGRPTATDPLPGCYGETGRSLTWDRLTVYLSDSASGPVLLTGWSVEAGASRLAWRLPYDVAAGDGVRKALTSVPGATGAVPEEGENTVYFEVRTHRAPGLTWTSTTADENGRVAEVDFRGEGCD